MSLEEEYLISPSESGLKLINKLKREIEARKRFQMFIDMVASDGMASMEELKYLEQGE